MFYNMFCTFFGGTKKGRQYEDAPTKEGSQRPRPNETPSTHYEDAPTKEGSQRPRPKEAHSQQHEDAPTKEGSQRPRPKETPSSQHEDAPRHAGSQRPRPKGGGRTPCINDGGRGEAVSANLVRCYYTALSTWQRVLPCDCAGTQRGFHTAVRQWQIGAQKGRWAPQ